MEDNKPFRSFTYTPISERITGRLKENNVRYFANDNISEYIRPGELDGLIAELADKFQEVLKSLVIDVDNDPNSAGTGRRLAKMYVNEIMSGRYHEEPAATSFPNDGVDAYKGMLVVRAEIKSMCSHHHQPVTGVAYIGVIPEAKVLGLSKYVRIAQWTARRGTLQEQLCNEIARNISAKAECKNVAVYLKLEHGCCSNRGIMASDSTTQTTVLLGEFNKSDVKKEFFDNIVIQGQIK